MPLSLYLVLCVLVPAAWGAIVHVGLDWLHRRRRPPEADDPPPIDYSI